MKRNSFRYSYTVIEVGGVLLILFFLGYFPPWNWHWDDPSDILGWLELLGWIASPLAVFAGIIFLFARYSGKPSVGISTLISAVGLVAVTVIWYARLFFPPPADPANPGSFEPNLVFIFAPLYQYPVVLLSGVVCLLVGIVSKISARKARAD